MTVQGPFAALWRLTHAEAPLALVLYGDPLARQEWSEELRPLLAGQGSELRTTANVEEAFADLDIPLLLLPEPEQQSDAVRRLSVGRDKLTSRTATAVLFLLRGGAGQTRLQDEPALASFLAGVTLDPDAGFDVEAGSRQFEASTGMSPADFIEATATPELPDTLENAVYRLQALLLGGGA